MKKRLLSLLMAVLMAALLLPVEAFAITGGDVRRLYMDTAPVTITKEGIDSGSQIYSMKMKNGRLVMFIATSGPYMGKSVTNSTGAIPPRGIPSAAACMSRRALPYRPDGGSRRR